MSYQNIFDSNPLPLWVVSRDGLKFLNTNAAATELFGFTKAEFRRMTLADLQTPAEVECFQQAVSGQDFKSANLCGWRGRTKSGEMLDLELKIRAASTRTSGSNGTVLVVVPLDVHERTGLEQQMRQAQKMEAVGMLAGGIAHDFNNLLTIIAGYTQMLIAGPDTDERDLASLEQILKASDRAADLTRQLLHFSRRQNTPPKVLSLNTIVTGMSKMVRRLISEHVDLRIQLGEDAGTIRVDPGKAEQVILNLVVNSRDALSTGGKLTIATRREEVDEDRANTLHVRPGRFAVLSVNDTGVGMDTKTCEQIFEPFFTTKEHGTGLGLSTVYGIVKQVNGSIDIWSEPGVGTSMDVYFPSFDDEVTVEPPEEEFPAAQGRETILIVEDEEAIRRLVQTSLEQNGYRVLLAADGLEALKMISSQSSAPDMVITDLAMPGMTGTELAKKLKDRLPAIEILYISGYGADWRQSGDIDETCFLQKPFAPQLLAHKVRDLLDRRGRHPENQTSGA